MLYLVTRLPGEVLGAAIALLMLAVALFVVMSRRAGVTPKTHVGRRAALAGHLVTAALGVYGGLFSVGYVTVLTTAFVALFNLGSSLVVTAVYAWARLIEWRLGALLSGVILVGATVGARLALQLGNEVVRRVFLGVVTALAPKALVDLEWEALGRYLNFGGA